MFLWFTNLFGQSDDHKPVSQANNDDGDGQQEDDKKDRTTTFASFIDQSEKRCPRMYNIIFMIIVPLFFLIALAMLFGHFLAKLESGNELDSIQSSMEDFVQGIGREQDLVKRVQGTYEKCVERYAANKNGEVLDGTNLIAFMTSCSVGGLDEAQEMIDVQTNATAENNIMSMSFNWNRCYDNEDAKDFDNAPKFKSNHEQAANFYEEWLETFLTTLGQNASDYDTAVDAANDVTKESCKTNTAGGALFWFTIMTTIGYGNTAPVTASGRALVFTMGFISILAFTACIGSASYVFLAIADDFFLRVIKMKRFANGFLSVLFWLVIFWLWILVLVGVNALYSKARYGAVADAFVDRLWWAFISVTTVGFGDFHIPHDTFTLVDMLYVPLTLLVGFVFLANFLLKLCEVTFNMIKAVGLADDESLNYLMEQERKGQEGQGDKDDVSNDDLCSFVPEILMNDVESDGRNTVDGSTGGGKDDKQDETARVN